MKHSIYCIKDTKVNNCNPPVLFLNDAAATRAFGDLLTKDKESILAAHPEDFVLLRLGDIDDDSGRITAIDPVCVCSGVDFVSK